ncbi:DUF4260 domain-containing protein [Olivibacter sp. SDN3]|uniref:DUF4260 domain-containing protein n=1 Tax=Olivibacter sp. SDN3 TaxID=2764720 RepID=UPI0016510EF1|nr:DUF4260 domain-containing protein [Olivibacter sp. SDN3]QNL48000.1 DUF4260 domain-containing protein [Olivibacter sp. SDN3]
MKLTLKIEEITMLTLSFLVFVAIGYAWWLFFALLLLPDISMLGYFAGNKTGAIIYNIGHHKGIALFIALLGYYFTIPYFLPAGIILFAHSSMDRAFGYGLKYTTGFKHTHLGQIGGALGN